MGLALGMAAALAVTRLLEGLLFGVAAHAFVLVPAVLLAVAVAASYLPARRATAIDPTSTLRTT